MQAIPNPCRKPLGVAFRLKWVEIKGYISFHDEIKQSVYFISTTFSEGARFRSVKFSGYASFAFSTFSKRTEFSLVTFSQDADFTDTKFSGDATFYDATFNGSAYFRPARFSGDATFYDAKFSKRASFTGTTFSKGAEFSSATFGQDTDFYGVKFRGNVDFNSAQFLDGTSFSYAQFEGNPNFSNCRFKDFLRFVGCLYQSNTKMNFSGVTGFSNSQFEWKYEPKWNKDWEAKGKNQKRGLKGHLEYDKIFYIALIKNYQDMGWLGEADDCYYTYRVEKRSQVNEDGKLLNSWHKRAVEYIFLDFPFGYGVKPFKLLRSFLIMWIPFSLFYVCFLRHDEKGTTPWATAPYT